MNEEIGLVAFGNEAITCASAPSHMGHYSISQGADVEAITKYLERPVIISTGILGASPGNLYRYGFQTTASYRTLFGATNWDRLDGAVGIRATLVFTLSVTASAFNQGILAVAYQYGLSTINNLDRSQWFPLVTNLPHVRLNVAETTTVQLEVPYVSSLEYIPIVDANLTTAAGGIVSVTQLTGSPVASGQDPPRYTLYVSMKDIEIIGALPFETTTLTVQTGLRTENLTAAPTKGVDNTTRSSVTEEGHAVGVLSGALDGVAQVARAVKTIPGLSDIGGTADWFASLASRTARSLGYSKPMDEKQVMRHNLYAYGLDSQVDVPCNGFVASAFQGQKLAIGPDLGMSDEDEMAFDNLLTRYQYLYRGQMFSTTSPGDILWVCPVMPTAFWYRDVALGPTGTRANRALPDTSDATTNALLPTTLCYIADNFRLWRGAFKFRITFAKTKLHGGRVQVSFVPYTENSALNAPIATTSVVPATSALGPVASGYSYIFDLRDASSFEFEVPYITNQPYTSVQKRIGDVSMQVVSALRTNASAPTLVDFMVEVAALPGFELAVPAPSLMTGVPTTGTVAVRYESGLHHQVDYQVGMDFGKTTDDVSQAVLGERFTSVKQVIMIPDFFVQDQPTASIYDQTFEPWFKPNAAPLAIPMSPTLQRLYFGSRSSRMALLYAFCRGGSMAIVMSDDSVRLTTTVKWRGNFGGTIGSSNGSFYSKYLNQYSTITVAETQDGFRVKIPFYTPFARVSLQGADDTLGGSSSGPNSNTWPGTFSNIVPQLVVRNTSGTTSRLLIGRAAADDAILARFVGPPPCVILNSAATVNPVYGNASGTLF
jgi:hypothetical protein